MLRIVLQRRSIGIIGQLADDGNAPFLGLVLTNMSQQYLSHFRHQLNSSNKKKTHNQEKSLMFVPKCIQCYEYYLK